MECTGVRKEPFYPDFEPQSIQTAFVMQISFLKLSLKCNLEVLFFFGITSQPFDFTDKQTVFKDSSTTLKSLLWLYLQIFEASTNHT